MPPWVVISHDRLFLHDECKGMSTFPSYSFGIMEEAENYGSNMARREKALEKWHPDAIKKHPFWH